MRLAPLFAAPLLLALAIPAAAQETPTAEPATLTVTGHGSASAAPDLATVRLGVETQAKAPAEAMQQNTAAVERIIAEIREAGIEPKDIQTANFSVFPVYDHNRAQRLPEEGPEVVGFRVTNEVIARVRDLDGLGSVLSAVVDAGANRINGLSFEIEDDRPVRDQARRAAVEDARHAAELYAEAAGVDLVRILSIADTFAGPPMPMQGRVMRMEAMDSAAVPIEQGENTVEATVNMVWEIAPGG